MRILACIDFSPLSDRIAAEAGALARAAGGKLTLLHAARTEPVLTTGGVASPHGHRVPPDDLADKRGRMNALVAYLRGGGVDAEGRVVVCDDVLDETLLAEAGAIDARYLVVGSHGHGRVFELVLGSVTQALIRNARIPVLVVPAQAAAAAPTGGAPRSGA